MHQSKIKGFSLVELLIVLAIMAIMAGTLFVNRDKVKAASEVEVATRQVAAQLRALQNEALNGKIINNERACGMQFNTNPSDLTKSYGISYYDCAGALISGSGQDFLIGKSATNKLVSITNNGYVKFLSPQAAIDSTVPPIGAARAIVIKSTKDETVINLVCIYDDGSIVETKNPTCS